ncbi:MULTISPECIES: GntR family transcriptional regulator [Rossellomorea]|jgi:GntR family transcriptional regulator|uniref:GntR family transcriptional regulator n=1 Tax=Rossellomorea aquimaris TaxID=189382 RepID=A0A5D4UKF9_9BACI|nr:MULTISPECIES: GntR family transcriptional regulator [Rossellomorea]MDT9025390.1 GntR family transcriptional regulator [Rossellomorea sp. YC4-1]TYS77760.1 GntR family transcriptional regulator [Rossellomorea aquimaris]TYS86942.1 GntR family transcriptional regulator [Rossellomorea aquimaris]TYS87756.1 GntR family transcriptional regulator [Rossellomorea aquimaris]
MTEEYTASKPIYLQIADRIIREIVRKELSPGDKLPSVREMAVQSGVNPNTIQRTYSELERMDIVETRRGQGTFVTEKEEVLSVLNEKLQEEVIELFIKNMKELGLSKEQMIKSVERYLAERGGE